MLTKVDKETLLWDMSRWGEELTRDEYKYLYTLIEDDLNKDVE